MIALGIWTAVNQSFQQSRSPMNGGTPVDASPNIVFVGSSIGLAGRTLEELRSRPGASIGEVAQLAELWGVVGQVGASSIVIFESEWFVGKESERELLDFFAAILPTETRIVAIGGRTSLLFEALDQVRDIFVEGRNPAYDNPPLAGYKLKRATTPEGTAYYGESVLNGYATDAVETANSILTWG